VSESDGAFGNFSLIVFKEISKIEFLCSNFFKGSVFKKIFRILAEAGFLAFSLLYFMKKNNRSKNSLEKNSF